MNAPEPTLTSSTSAPVPSAIFLLMIERRDERDRLDRAGDVAQRVELLVGGREPVAGGADDGADVLELARASPRWTASARQPGIDSSLSSVPPVWPRPRPDSCGTATPHAATSGASGRVILSPTPPVECLSAVGRDSAGEVHPLAGGDHRGGPAGDLARGHAVEQDRHGERGHLLVGDRAAGVGVDHPVDLLVGELAAVALGADDVDGVEGSVGPSTTRLTALGSRRSGRRGRRRPAAPRRIGADAARRVSTSRSGPPFSHSSWRQRPHGIRASPWPSTQTNATSRPPPVACSAETRPHSAHSADPVRGVLDVAAGDDAAVVDERRRRRPGSRSTARRRAP